LAGNSDVKVTLTDINDNAPIFEGSPFVGYITENQDVTGTINSNKIYHEIMIIFYETTDSTGVYVRTVTAIDRDDGKNAELTYDIQRNKYFGDKPVFRIDSNEGKIFALVLL